MCFKMFTNTSYIIKNLFYNINIHVFNRIYLLFKFTVKILFGNKIQIIKLTDDVLRKI
jgi:hypothetical protein